MKLLIVYHIHWQAPQNAFAVTFVQKLVGGEGSVDYMLLNQLQVYVNEIWSWQYSLLAACVWSNHLTILASVPYV